MMILGLNGGMKREWEDESGTSGHDSAAVLVQGKEILAAVEEERLNRIKHSNHFPARAIRYCLEVAQATLADVDVIVADVAEKSVNAWLLTEVLKSPSLPFGRARQAYASLFRNEFGIDVTPKIRFCPHHLAHLYSTWIPSGFADALCVCIDGDGDSLSGLIAHCSDGNVKVLRYLRLAQSLGRFYTSMISIIGYKRFDEYKVMGLAPYGDPGVYAPLFRNLCRLLPEGEFALVSAEERIALLSEAGLLDNPRRRGEPFTQQHKDFAAALQQALELVVSHLVAHFQRVTGATNLCLAGGVAHNCTMNGRLAAAGNFKRIYVQPAAHDAGAALGAALAVAYNEGRSRDTPAMPHLYLGRAIESGERLERRLRDWSGLVSARRLEDTPRTAAKLIADGSVIGWVQGRSEFGPRALGNRSILADPRPAQNKQIINSMVKKREAYRPFAPAVLESALSEYFEVPPSMPTAPFMVVTMQVQPRVRQLLGAVTHVDGSARVQSVSADTNPRFHALIEAIGEITGVPIVLNTSFNNNAEPIVDDLDEAIACFLTTGIHAMIVEDWLVEKPAAEVSMQGVLELVPTLAPGRKLVVRTSGPGKSGCYVESICPGLVAERQIPISAYLFAILTRCDDGTSLASRVQQLQSQFEGEAPDAAEILSLWRDRALHLAPARPVRSPA